MSKSFAALFCLDSESEGRVVVIPSKRLHQSQCHGTGGLRDRLKYLRPAGQLPTGPGAHTDAGAR